MNPSEKYLVSKMTKRLFDNMFELMEPGLSTDPEVKQVVSKTEEVLIDVINNELTEEEMFHFMQSINHSLQLSAKRYTEINKKIYAKVMEALEGM